jgi:type III secretory pathway component EscT
MAYWGIDYAGKLIDSANGNAGKGIAERDPTSLEARVA